MLDRILTISLLVPCFCFASQTAAAQEVVHAMIGTVSSISPATKTIGITMTDGSQVFFRDMTKSNVSLEFDKELQAGTKTAQEFGDKGAEVIVYYCGEGNESRAVALQDLGTSAALKTTVGTLAKFDKHDRLVVIQNSAGANDSFQLTPKTVVETSVGAAEGRRFDPRKGDSLRVTAAKGSDDALFIYAK